MKRGASVVEPSQYIQEWQPEAVMINPPEQLQVIKKQMEPLTASLGTPQFFSEKNDVWPSTPVGPDRKAVPTTGPQGRVD